MDTTPVRTLRRRLLAGLLVVAGFTTLAAPAAQARWVGGNPSADFGPQTPAACAGRGAVGGACLAAGIAALDASRAREHLPAYRLPGDFASLTGAEQMFVLTDSDRVAYGLAPIAGITASLDASAAVGVRADADPSVALGPFTAYTANWAGGDPDVVWAYQNWMYDDGPGSDNLDCTAAGADGCWGHRHDILTAFPATGGALAGGFAAGVDAAGRPGEAMVLTQLAPHAAPPAYGYTWRAALAAGA